MSIKTELHWSKPKGMLPNSRFPLLVHRNAVPGGGEEAVMARLRSNNWLNNWRYPGIYTYPHFHSTTHESRRTVAKRIMMLPIPALDPATGLPMIEWIDAPSSVDADLNDFRDGLGEG